MAGKAKRIIALCFTAIFGVGMQAISHFHPDDLAPLKPYIVSDETVYAGFEWNALSPGAPPDAPMLEDHIIVRRIYLKGLSKEMAIKLCQDIISHRRGWNVVDAYPSDHFYAVQGDFMASGPRATLSATTFNGSICVEEDKPLTWWDRFILRVKPRSSHP